MNSSQESATRSKLDTFVPKKALVLGKFSRYEFEKHRNPKLTENEFIENVSQLF